MLESVNIIRKYVQLLDLPISLLSASYWYLVTHEQRQIIKVSQNIHSEATACVFTQEKYLITCLVLCLIYLHSDNLDSDNLP